MRTQARGLAAAVADVVVERIAPARFAWPGRDTEAFEPPWPDLLVTCGRRSAPLAASLRRRGASRLIAVHVQDPRCSLAAFDLVIAMAHDRIAARGKVIKVETALHDVTAASLARARVGWRERLAPFGPPLAGVLVGGTTSRGGFSTNQRRAFIEALVRLRAGGWGLAIVPSRRTPLDLRAEIAAAFAADAGAWVWDGVGENPYRGVLALADRLVVTGDSVSMISEALATGAAVEVFDLGIAHFSLFIEPLRASGALRQFTGDPAPIPRQAPIDPTPAAAARVRRLLQNRGFAPRTGSGEESCSRAIQASVT